MKCKCYTKVRTGEFSYPCENEAKYIVKYSTSGYEINMCGVHKNSENAWENRINKSRKLHGLPYQRYIEVKSIQ